MLHTTFRLLREANACEHRYRRFAKKLGGVRRYGQDTLIPLDKVLEINGARDVGWVLLKINSMWQPKPCLVESSSKLTKELFKYWQWIKFCSDDDYDQGNNRRVTDIIHMDWED